MRALGQLENMRTGEMLLRHLAGRISPWTKEERDKMKTNPGTHGLLSILVCLTISHAQIVSTRYKEFPNAAPGIVHKFEKIFDKKTGMIKTQKEGRDFSVEDLKAWENVERQAWSQKNGRLSEELESKRFDMGRLEKVKVVIQAQYPPFTYPDKNLYTQDELIASSLAAAALAPIANLEVLEARHGLSGCEHNGTGMATCEVTKGQLDGMRTDAEIGVVEAFHQERQASVSLSTLASSAYNPGPVPAGAGLGVHAATFEYGLNSTFVSCLGVPVTYDASVLNDNMMIRHTQVAFKSLVHAAPAATFYHRRSDIYSGTDDANYLISNGIQTVSLSLVRGTRSPYHSNYTEFLIMDDFAYRYPYPVFVNPTANDGYQYEVNWQGYNGISVGNVRNTGNSTFEMVDCTQTKNPPPVYGSCISGSGADCAGDREMPHIVVPGYPSTGTDFATTCLSGNGTVNCGTSWSAAVGNGIAASVLAADNRLVSSPEAVRATLILTAQNVDASDWSTDTDERDGTGVVSGSEAVAFAKNHTLVSFGNSAVESGMVAGALYAADFSAGNKRFNYHVPNSKPAGKHLRVVLTWDSNPVIGAGINALSDLDLIVQYNGSTKAAASWDSNVEVVDIAASDLSAGSNYYIDISLYANRIPASGARANYLYYAIAWTWVKDHAI